MRYKFLSVVALAGAMSFAGSATANAVVPTSTPEENKAVVDILNNHIQEIKDRSKDSAQVGYRQTHTEYVDVSSQANNTVKWQISTFYSEAAGVFHYAQKELNPKTNKLVTVAEVRCPDITKICWRKFEGMKKWTKIKVTVQWQSGEPIKLENIESTKALSENVYEVTEKSGLSYVVTVDTTVPSIKAETADGSGQLASELTVGSTPKIKLPSKKLRDGKSVPGYMTGSL